MFSPADAEALLSLFPDTRIKLAVYDRAFDTDVRDGLAEAAAVFFLGCSWPTYGDKVDVDEFISLLRRQAAKLGFSPSQI